jgi:hypothetical protein
MLRHCEALCSASASCSICWRPIHFTCYFESLFEAPTPSFAPGPPPFAPGHYAISRFGVQVRMDRCVDTAGFFACAGATSIINSGYLACEFTTTFHASALPLRSRSWDQLLICCRSQSGREPGTGPNCSKETYAVARTRLDQSLGQLCWESRCSGLLPSLGS